MRNREAARYARWSAIAAACIVLAVGGVYIYRAVQRARARRAAPAAVPASVERQSAQFRFSKIEQDRTLFTIRASEATQFKDRDRALLKDVWITIYGQHGNRDDDIHTRECGYDPHSGDARCEGSVQIDVEGAKSAAAPSNQPALRLVTSDLTFNRDTGDASTTAPVEFTFPGGTGGGVGVEYSTRDSTLRIQHAIKFNLTASDKTGGLPVNATGSSLEIHRDDRRIVLDGPAIVRQGDRVLTAADISVELDAQNRAQRVMVAGQPEIHANEPGGAISVSAAQFEGLLNPAGWVERVIADGNVRATRQSKTGTGHFAAAHVEFVMSLGRNLIQDMLATGGVMAESKGSAGSYTLRTAALRVAFSTPERNGRTRDDAPAKAIAGQQIESAETLAPATVELTKGNEATTLSAKKLVAQAGANGRLTRVLGHSGVQIRRQVPGGAPQTISADEMAASLGANGEWETVQETGDVRMKQGDRQAAASSARIDRASDTIDLDGSPVVTDGASSTSANSMTFNQNTGALQATVGVVSTYLAGDGAEDAVNLGSGAAHISADTLTGSAKSEHVTYEGHVRLWQGESVLEAERIEIWRDGKKMQASGNVVAVFPQSAGPAIPDFDKSIKRPGQAPEPTRWKVRAPLLTYWGDQGRAHLEGGVTASSDQGTLNSRTLDVYLAPAAATTRVRGGAAPGPARSATAAANFAGGGELNRVVAKGGVVVQQGDRRGVAEQAEYTAADGKFVLSGGHPTVTDSSSNTATGTSLTFYVANDTILIDSQEGSRTLTKHRVEK